MKKIPECLSKRYKAVDELITELGAEMPDSRNNLTCPTAEDPSVKLMCKFWNILKQEPDLNLTREVRERMYLNRRSSIFRQQPVTCFVANEDKRRRSPRCKHSEQRSDSEKEPRGSQSSTSENVPLNKALDNLKEAATVEKQCKAKATDLLEQEQDLQEQINELENREREGLGLLKQADSLWTCMETAYKKKLADSLERQKVLLENLRDVEKSNAKWRKLRIDLEFQLGNVNKCHREITNKINQRNNDINTINAEIENLQKRIESNDKDLNGSQDQVNQRKEASNKKLANIAAQAKKLEKKLQEERKYKQEKEKEGNDYVEDSRDDLRKLSKKLLQKRLENDDLRAEKEGLLLEIELLKETHEQCKEKCKSKVQTIEDEIKKVENDIATFKVKCIQCHECTNTEDIRKMCTDCPRCNEDKDCILESDHCIHDSSMDCACMVVKQKFLDNVFENMYTVLERQIKSREGKTVADAIVDCLKKSRNGKLNDKTKKMLQNFILNGVKKNLNLTIVGGAVKTRCEMDPELYKELMLCLKSVKTIAIVKTEKGTDAKKEPCSHWGGSNECNCPKGPKSCICSKKGLPQRGEDNSCPDFKEPADKQTDESTCPHKETNCGANCGMSSIGTDVAAWRPKSCQEPSCQYKNMRAVQCVIGPEAMSSSRAFVSTTPYIPPESMVLADQISCKCGGVLVTPCPCQKGGIQPNVYANKVCDQKSCNVLHTHNSADSMDVEHSLKLITNDQCDTKTVSKSVSNTVEKIHSKHDISNFVESCNKSPKITRTSSGNLELTVSNKKIFELIDKRIQNNNSLSVYLKRTQSGHLNTDFRTSENKSVDGQRVVINRTDSGSLFLQGDKKISTNKSKKLKETCKKNRILTENDITKFLLNILNSKKSSNPNKSREKKIIKKSSSTQLEVKRNKFLENKASNLNTTNVKSEIVSETSLIEKSISTIKREKAELHKLDLCFPVKLKGVLCPFVIQSLLVAKLADSGIYEILFDKEFDKTLRQIIKDIECYDKEHFIKMYKDDFEHYILDLRSENEPPETYKNAMLMKSPSGGIKVVPEELTKKGLIKNVHTHRKCVLAPKSLEEIFDKLNHCQTTPTKEKLKIKEYLRRDSILYTKASADFHRQADAYAMLKKSLSSQFEIVFDKEAKEKFIKYLKEYLNISNEWKPVKITQCGGSTSSALGNQYISADERKYVKKEICTTASGIIEKQMPRIIGKEKTHKNREISTNCNGGDYSFCNLNKCVCKNMQYKYSNWIQTDSENEGINSCFGESNLSCDSCKNMGNYLQSLNRTSPHIIKKPCSYHLDSSEKNHARVAQSICPYHIEKYDNVSNELLEISGLSSRILEKPKEQNSNIYVQKNPLNSISWNKKNIPNDWDSMEFLPPQLPLFLRSYVSH